MWLLGNDNEIYGVIYEVIQDNSGASLEPLWAMKITRNIECTSSEYILSFQSLCPTR